MFTYNSKFSVNKSIDDSSKELISNNSKTANGIFAKEENSSAMLLNKININ